MPEAFIGHLLLCTIYAGLEHSSHSFILTWENLASVFMNQTQNYLQDTLKINTTPEDSRP